METHHINKESTCRACLEHENDNLKSIYQNETILDKNIKLCTVLNYCTNLDVYEGDGLPGKICEKCANDLVKAFIFKQQFIRANTILRQQLSRYTNEKTSRNINNYSFEHVFIKSESENNNTKLSSSVTGNTIFDIRESTEIDNYYENICDDDASISNEDEIPQNNDTQTQTADSILEEKKEKINQKLKDLLGNHDKVELTNRAIGSYLRELKRKPKTQESFTCEICSKTLCSAGSLKTHLLTHTKVNQYLCSTCGAGFKTKTAYEDHIVSHDPNNPYKCKECDKCCKSERNLKDHHMRAHSQVKPYVCGVCGKGLTQKVALQKHMMIHTGEKPFECDICGKHFRYKNVLVLHRRYHTGERPYTCPECGQTFIGRSHYRTHLLIHTGVKPYECDICGKCFNRRTNLRSHRKIHTGEREHICTICGKGFIQNNCLRAHMATHDNHQKQQNSKQEEILVEVAPNQPLEVLQ